jgi:hypothetical protein
MGHEIVYCSECACRLLGTDFDKGKAFRVEHKCLCADCAKKLLGALPSTSPATPKPGTQRIQVQKSVADSGGRTRLRESTVSRGVPAAGGKKSAGPLIAALIGAAAVVAVAVALATSGGAPPAPPPPKGVDTPLPPETSARERDARAAFDKALAYGLGNPSDFDGQLSRLQDAVFKAEGTSILERAKTELDAARVRAQQTLKREIANLETRVRPLLDRGDAAAARLVLDGERKRFQSRDWDLAIRRLGEEGEKPPPPPAGLWTVLDLQDLRSAGGATLQKLADGSVLASGENGKTDVFTFSARSSLKNVTAIRIEALPDASLPNGGPGRAGHGNAVLGEIRVEAGGRPVAFAGASASHEQEWWPSSAAIDGNPLTGWALMPRVNAPSEAVFHAREPFDGAALAVALEFQCVHWFHILGRFRVSATSSPLPAPPAPREIEACYAAPIPLYGDTLGSGWGNWSWNSKVDLKSAAVPPFEGASSIALETQQNGAALYFGTKQPVDDPGYLSFAVYRVDPNAFPYGVCVYGAGDKEFSAALPFSKLGPPPVGQWRRYVIPMSEFKLPSGKVRGVLLQGYYRAFPVPPVYVDAVQLLPGPVIDAEGVTSTSYRLRWNQAAVHAAARDLDTAIKLLAEDVEAKADVADLRLVRALHEEVRGILAKWPRGWNVAVDVLDAAGAVRRIDEPVRHADARGLELRGGELLEPGRILAPSLAEIFLARPKKLETDARAAGLLCAIEGFPDAAKRFYPGALKAGPPAPDDAEARRAYLEAEAETRGYATRASGLEKLAGLLKSHGETSYVRRLRGSIQARLDAPRDFLFAPADLQPRGFFQLLRHAKGEIAWTMTEEVEKPSRKDHALDLEYSAPPGTEVRGWALIGGCCQETFTFYLQGTDVEGPDAENAAMIVKCEIEGTSMTPVLPQGVTYLRKTHAAHGGGKKETERFAWVALPPLKRAGPGTQAKLRILADQQAFAVAAVFLSASRKTLPKEAELQELLSARPFAEPELAEAGLRGTILREIWKGIPGDSVAELTSHPKFKGPPDLSHRVGALDSWNMGDSYGTRFRGWIVPPLSGPYVFWLTSDDCSEFWLSTDDGPAGLKKAVALNGSVGHREWSRAAKSAPVPLVKGRRYYLEAFQKQGGGGEHVTVGWTLPDGAEEKPILGNRLIPWSAAASRGGATLDVPPAHPAGGPLAMSVGAAASGTPRIEIYDGTVRLGEAKAGAFTWAQPAVGAHLLSARVAERGGRTLVSPASLVVVGDLHFLRGLDFNGPGGSIDDRAWTAGPRANGFDGPDIDLRPATDAARSPMIRSSVALRDAARAVVDGLPGGKLLVYATVWAPVEPAPVDLAVNGKTVVSGHRFNGVGEWARLGPWAAEAVEGKLELSAPKGTAHVSGVEVWGPTRPEPSQRGKTEAVGGPGGAAFEDAPAGNPFLVGFRLTRANGCLKSLQPIYWGDGKAVNGDQHATPEGDETEILAKGGYAVGGIRVKAGGDRIRAFRVVFMRSAAPYLDMKDTYESDWYLGDATDTVLLGGDGCRVIGVHGRAGNEIDALGLVLLKP